ncbi:hypothetical protein TrST_g7788 [Triparma strigata]|uniref:Calmodulin n=1 Tax=Triparma strigata TaxID=1606541 RepID=A0A9W7EGF8_9STRA|nr:hypothetical protein TrST_g7788 [Triparma strigata]
MASSEEENVSLLLEYHATTKRAAISLASRSYVKPEKQVHGSSIPLPPSIDPTSPSHVYLTKLDWSESLHITDICVTSKPFKDVRDAHQSHHFLSSDVGRTDLLDFLAAFVENGWTMKASGADDKFWFEKFVPGFQTPGSAISTKSTLTRSPSGSNSTASSSDMFVTRTSLTNQQETTEFKQKMIFGIQVIKVPTSMTSLSPAVKSKEITLRLKGSGKDLSVSWESKKADEILVRDIIDIKTEGTGKSARRMSNKAVDKGKYFTITTDKRELTLMAKSTREAFWFVKGFDGLIKEAQTAGKKKKRASKVDLDLAAELWDDDDEEINPVVEDSDLQEILHDVELVGEVRLKRGKTLSNKQLVQIQETFETRQGAASILQKIVRKMVGALGSEQLDFSPEELYSCFKVFDEDGDGAISTSELRHVLMNIGGMRMSEQEVAEIVRRFDQDNDGNIDYKEFAMGLMSQDEEERKSMVEEVKAIEKLNLVEVKKEVTTGKSRVNKAKEVMAPVQYEHQPLKAESSRKLVTGEGELIIEDVAGVEPQGAGKVTIVEGVAGGIVLPERESFENKRANMPVGGSEPRVSEGNEEEEDEAPPKPVVVESKPVPLEVKSAEVEVKPLAVKMRPRQSTISEDKSWQTKGKSPAASMLKKTPKKRASMETQEPINIAPSPTPAPAPAPAPARSAAPSDSKRMQLAGASYNKPVEVTEEPIGWQKITGDDDSVYWYNHTTGESSWTDPEKKADDLPEGWVSIADETYGEYFYHEATGETSYDRPGAEGEGGSEEPSIRESMSLPVGWKEVTDKEYGVYYFNESTNDTVYTKPGAESELPEGWAEAKDEGGNTYYYHENGDTTYDKPGSEEVEPSVRESVSLPSGWAEVSDASYGIYYYNESTGETSYEKP